MGTHIRLFIGCCFCLLSTSGKAQNLHLFLVDTAMEWVAGYDYYNSVTLSEDKIIHSFNTTSYYESVLLPYGDVHIKTYDPEGNLAEQESSHGDSLFIRKIILRSNGEKIILGEAFHHIALYDSDTSCALNDLGDPKSFILYLDSTNHSISMDRYFPVKDMALDETTGKLYFAEQYDYEDARLYALNLSTGVKDTLAIISGPRVSARILKTPDYIYLSGASISFFVDINEHHTTTAFPYANFIAQLDNTGNLNWINMTEDVTTPNMGIAPAPEQGVYMSADLSEATVIGDQALQGPTWGSDFFLTHIDSNGQFLWVTEVPNNTLCGFMLGNGYFIDSDEMYNIYIAGASRALIQWDDSTVVGRDTNIHVPAVLIYDKEGHVFHHIIASDGEPGSFSSIDVSGNGDFALTGRMQSSLTFNDMTKTVAEGYQPFFLYYKNSPSMISEVSERGPGFRFYPNPLTSEHVLTIERARAGKSAVEIWNLLGQKVCSGYIYDKIDAVQLPDLNTGLYFVRVGQQTVQKLIIQ